MPDAYESCAGAGQLVSDLTQRGSVIGPGMYGGDGEGRCAVCGRVVSQRGGVAKRHRDKRAVEKVAQQLRPYMSDDDAEKAAVGVLAAIDGDT